MQTFKYIDIATRTLSIVFDSRYGFVPKPRGFPDYFGTCDSAKTPTVCTLTHCASNFCHDLSLDFMIALLAKDLQLFQLVHLAITRRRTHLHLVISL